MNESLDKFLVFIEQRSKLQPIITALRGHQFTKTSAKYHNQTSFLCLKTLLG